MIGRQKKKLVKFTKAANEVAKKRQRGDAPEDEKIA